jgi:hypothetical protein
MEQHRAFVTLPAPCWALAGSALAPAALRWNSGDDSQPKIGQSTVVQRQGAGATLDSRANHGHAHPVADAQVLRNDHSYFRREFFAPGSG